MVKNLSSMICIGWFISTKKKKKTLAFNIKLNLLLKFGFIYTISVF